MLKTIFVCVQSFGMKIRSGRSQCRCSRNREAERAPDLASPNTSRLADRVRMRTRSSVRNTRAARFASRIAIMLKRPILYKQYLIYKLILQYTPRLRLSCTSIKRPNLDILPCTQFLKLLPLHRLPPQPLMFVLKPPLGAEPQLGDDVVGLSPC